MKKCLRYICQSLMLCLAVIYMLSACDISDTPYHHYKDISEEGWLNCDTLTFQVDTIRKPGDYITYLCLRTQYEYPYRYLSVIVDQVIMPKGKRQHAVERLEIVDREGVQKGTGITYHTYEVPVFTETLTPGDSMRVAVKHNMTREQMPGIIGVGVKVKRKGS